MVFTDNPWVPLTGNPDVESLNGRLLFAIPKKGASKSFLQEATATETVTVREIARYLSGAVSRHDLHPPRPTMLCSPR